MTAANHPVVIVGAGPTGLTLAGELRLAGVPVEVVERLPEPTGQSRAPGVYAGTLEIWNQRGLLDRFADHLRFGAYGHFALLPGGLDLSRLDTPRAAALVPQSTVEAVLAGWAAEMGARIRRGHHVVGVRPDRDGVTVEIATADGDYRLRAGYLVGCDGGRSAVRRLGGFEFCGTESTVDVLLADLAGIGAETLDIPRRPFPFLRTEHGWVGLSQATADTVRVFVCDFGRPPRGDADPPDFVEVQAAAARVAGDRFARAIGAGTPRWLSRFGNSARQATQYRIGRVLLAGDAAHVHPPFGGQGIGVGLQDAVNLGWKLAAEIHGWAPPDLVDTYHAERHPAAGRVLRLAQAQDALMRPGTAVAQLREVLAEVTACPDANALLAAEVTGLNLRYELSVLDSGGHDLLGRRLPGAVAPLRWAKGAFVTVAGSGAPPDVLTAWSDRVRPVAAEAGLTDRLAEVTALLVRPDGHIAWVSTSHQPDHDGLERALWRWFGAPSARKTARPTTSEGSR